MKKMTKNVWLALMLMFTLCVSKTHAQQKFDQNGNAIEPAEEGTSVVNNNQNTPKNVNQNSSQQSTTSQNTSYQTSIGTNSYSTSTNTGCCNHSNVNIVNMNLKFTGGVNNFSEPPRERTIIIDGTKYFYVNNGSYYGYSSGRRFIPMNEVCDNFQWRPRKEENHQRPRRDNYKPPTQTETPPTTTTQTHHGIFQNETHGGGFNNGTHGGDFANSTSVGTTNPPKSTGGNGNGNGAHSGHVNP